MSRPIVFLDTETTGLGPDREAWEIAMVRRPGDGQADGTYSTFVNVADMSKADPMALRFSRFYDRHPSYRRRGGTEDERLVEEAKAAKLVEDWTRGAVIVGAVPNFDTEVLDKLLRRHGLIPAWHYHLIDIETMALGWLMQTGHFSPSDWLNGGMKSDDLSKACGVDPPDEDERHTALGDAHWVLRWYDTIMAR